tara:strand:- start:400 stop:591 length:192 start_codon:yes stop_codon:yes gene_type:complete
MSKVITVEKIKDKTSSYKKIHVKYLSIKQREHLGIFKNNYLNKFEIIKFERENYNSNNEYILR